MTPRDPNLDASRIEDAVRDRFGRDDLTARLLFASLAQHLAGDGIRLVVVGGTAVDAYVGGAFGTSEG
jgi:hypothetical protein